MRINYEQLEIVGIVKVSDEWHIDVAHPHHLPHTIILDNTEVEHLMWEFARQDMTPKYHEKLSNGN